MTDNLGSRLEQRLPAELQRLLRSAAEIAFEQGQSLYLVGGAVRDMLLGRANLDLDLVVEGDAPKLAALLAQREGGDVLVHRRFGTAKLRLGNLSVDLATARAETYAHPGALPTVRPGSISDDLRRRDFTINAMAVHLDMENLGRLLDPHGGERDLRNKLIRILHEKSFIDDATRMLRAVRYEQRFDFQLEQTTASLLRQDLAMLDTISADRVRHELDLILKEERPERILRRAGELGILRQVHPSLEGNGWLEERFRQARSGARPPSAALYLPLLLYRSSTDEGEQVVARLKIPGSAARVIRDALRLKEELPALSAAELPASAIYRLLRGYAPSSILANALASDSPLVRRRLHLYLDRLRYVKSSLDGEALKEMGIRPGPRLGEMLRALQEAKLDQKVKTRKEEEALVRRWLVEA